MTIFALRGGDSGQLEITYGQIRRLLEEQQVSQVSLQDDGSLSLWLKEPVDGQATVQYDVGNPDWFREDFNDLIVEQQRLGIISDYDYPKSWEPPYWWSFLPTVAILLVFGLLWYFMFLRQTGGGGGGGRLARRRYQP